VDGAFGSAERVTCLLQAMIPAEVLTGASRRAATGEICNLPLAPGAALSSTDCNCEVSKTRKVGWLANGLRYLARASEPECAERDGGGDPALGDCATVAPEVTASELPRFVVNGGAGLKGCVVAPVPAKVPVVLLLPPEPV
jgi:hypothetical protein